MAHSSKRLQTRRMGNPRTVIVYADDDDLVRNVVTQALIEEGIDVHDCASGSEAIALCRQIVPDAVLLDLNMPDVDGLAAARELRLDPVTCKLRLVALTGRATTGLRTKAADAGFDECLVKPIAAAELADALRG
jgi:CheY-like chemotaxis protein